MVKDWTQKPCACKAGLAVTIPPWDLVVSTTTGPAVSSKSKKKGKCESGWSCLLLSQIQAVPLTLTGSSSLGLQAGVITYPCQNAARATLCTWAEALSIKDCPQNNLRFPDFAQVCLAYPSPWYANAFPTVFWLNCVRCQETYAMSSISWFSPPFWKRRGGSGLHTWFSSNLGRGAVSPSLKTGASFLAP